MALRSYNKPVMLLMQDTLADKKGPLSSDTIVRHDVSSPSQEEVALLDVFMPHHPPLSDGEMYADIVWYMPHQNHELLGEEPNHPVPSCQVSIIVPCDHVVPDVLLRSSHSLGLV